MELKLKRGMYSDKATTIQLDANQTKIYNLLGAKLKQRILSMDKYSVIDKLKSYEYKIDEDNSVGEESPHQSKSINELDRKVVKDTFKIAMDNIDNIPNTDNKNINLRNPSLPLIQPYTSLTPPNKLIKKTLPNKDVVKHVEEKDTNIFPIVSPLLKVDNLTNIPLSISDFKNRLFNNNVILIPPRVGKKILTDTPISFLRRIHSNRQTAIDLCLLFLSQFSGSVFWKLLGRHSNHVSLSVDYMDDNYGMKNRKNIIKVLRELDIIESDDNPIQGIKNTHYWLTDTYTSSIQFKSHKLTSKRVIKLRSSIVSKSLLRAVEEPISRLTLLMYSRIVSLPTKKDLITKGNRMVKNKEGKKSKPYGKRGKKGIAKDKDNIRYYEDDIKLFEYLTQPSFFIPSISENAGGRVSHSFNLMPTWIREEIKIMNENTVSVDYSALHPNIMSGKRGRGCPLSHQEIAEALGISTSEVKIEHLSFYNKLRKSGYCNKNKRYEGGMNDSILYKYYQQYQPEILKYLLSEPDKSITKELFATEVDIMTQVMLKLESEGIIGMYVYDELRCQEKDAERVQQVMQEVVDEMGIPTTAKIELINKFGY